MAEELGFEPRRRFPDLPVFKTGPFSHLGIPPFFWCWLMDLHHRTRKGTDLQSAAFATLPSQHFLVGTTRIELVFLPYQGNVLTVELCAYWRS